MRRMTKAVLVLLTVLGSSAAAQTQGFQIQKTYADDFADVPKNEWYASEVKNAFELNMMNGDGDGLFRPTDNVTIAEAIKLAACMSAAGKGMSIQTADEADNETMIDFALLSEAESEEYKSARAAAEEWYKPYFDYAIENGIIEEGQFTDPYRPAKRHEVALLFRRALPDSYFAGINPVERVIDVSDKAPYADEILSLYKAGIMMGSDDYGSFKPESNIIRAEMAAIIGRIALPETRLSKELLSYSHYDAYLLDQTSSYDNKKLPMASAWLLDGRGGAPKTTRDDSNSIIFDISEDAGTAYIREFNEFSTGRVVLDTSADVRGEGAILEYRNAGDKPIYHLENTKNAWVLLQKDGTTIKMYDIGKDTTYSFRIIIDLDNARCTTYINGTDCGTYPLCADKNEANIVNFRFATTDAGTPTVTPGKTYSTVNYAVNEGFDIDPFYFTLLGGAARNAQNSSLILPEKAAAAVSFVPTGVKIAAEFSMILPKNESIHYTLCDGTNTVVDFSTDLDNFYVNNEMVYENYYGNLWYRLRFELDSDTQTILVKVNGIEAAIVPFKTPATSVDNLKIENLSKTTVETDSYKVFRLIDHDDYVPAPVKPKGEEKYLVGMNFCSLWQEGTHWGWGIISGFRDREPVLGYYDEGNPETADWEIKYLVEHGVDFEALCWYPDTVDAPIKDPAYSAQLYDGIKNAKYSHDIKYCLLWEMSNSNVPATLDDWKTYYVPYMIEYFFKDPRYVRVDNKALLASFGSVKLRTALGGDGAREAMDYLGEELKKIGYDGVYYIGHGGNEQLSSDFCDSGVDGAYSYGWFRQSYSASVNREMNLLWTTNPYGVDVVPTVSVGFNEAPWTGTRYPIMTKEDNLTLHKWVRDNFLPTYSKKPEVENLVWLSTWNEYGEGTYMMPLVNPEVGFRYLDVIREVYTDEGENDAINILPTAAQKERINHLYPQYRKVMTREYYDLYGNQEIKDEHIVYTLDCGADPDWTAWEVTSWSKNAAGSFGTSSKTSLPIALTQNFAGDFDARDITHIRVTMKSPTGSTIRFWYKGEDTSSYQGYTWTSETDDVTTYTIDTSGFPNFRGKLDVVRIDPTEHPGAEFMIKSIEFISLKGNGVLSKQAIVDDNEFDLSLSPYTTKEGVVLLPFDPVGTVIDSRLGMFYLWDTEKKQLTLQSKDKTIIFTAGSDIMLVDGSEVKLASPVEMADSLPAIPVKELCEAAGYGYTVTDDEKISIVTPRKAQVEAEIAARKPGRWDFNTIHDTEGWNSYTLSLDTANGCLRGRTAGSETGRFIRISSSSGLDLSEYSGVEVRLKYQYSSEEPSSTTIYFTTEDDPKWGEDKTRYSSLNSTDSNDEFEVYTFDFSEHEKWNGTLTGLRFDVFRTESGAFEIDYIRLIPKE